MANDLLSEQPVERLRQKLAKAHDEIDKSMFASEPPFWSDVALLMAERDRLIQEIATLKETISGPPDEVSAALAELWEMFPTSWFRFYFTETHEGDHGDEKTTTETTVRIADESAQIGEVRFRAERVGDCMAQVRQWKEQNKS